VQEGGEFLLRFEDIDFTRVREQYYGAIIEDLAWAGITFQEEPTRQLNRMGKYEQVLEDLKEKEMVYPCFCTRKELNAEIDLSAPQGNIPPLYGGKCKSLSLREREEQGLASCWRLDSEKAAQVVGEISFTDSNHGRILVKPALFGDVVLGRKDIQTCYHLSSVVDDADQKVTDIVRGEDLIESTHVHRVLQELLSYPEPNYHHHKLIKDEDGKRLAKRDQARSIRSLREEGMPPQEVLALIQEG